MELTQELIKEIYKYSNVWKKLKDFLQENSYIITKDREIKYIDYECLRFFILYALIENFFEQNGIIIDIDYWCETNDFEFRLFRNQFCIFFSDVCFNNFKTNDEAKYHAVLKACEVLESE